MPAGGSLVAVALVLLVTLGGLHWLERRPSLPGGGRARTIRLSASHALHIVELEGRRLVLGTGPDGAPTLLAELEPTPGWAHEQGSVEEVVAPLRMREAVGGR